VPTRPYSMTARAASAAATGERIIDAVVGLAEEQLLATISLDLVAARAGVTVQTVLRRFGSRAGLIEAATARAQDDVRDERRTPVGDLPAAMTVLVDHYEKSLDLLVVACDVTTWKLLRLDRGLSRPHTQARMERLVRAVLTTTTPGLGPEREG
jgi:AcrR family transcriptional regulator